MNTKSLIHVHRMSILIIYDEYTNLLQMFLYWYVLRDDYLICNNQLVCVLFLGEGRKWALFLPPTALLISLYSLSKVEALWVLSFRVSNVYCWPHPGHVQAAKLHRFHVYGFWHFWFILYSRKHDLKLKNTSQTHMPKMHARKLTCMHICVWISRNIAHLRIVIAILK